MGKLLTLGLFMVVASQSIASKNLDSYVLSTGEAGAKRLDFQSKLMNDQSFLHVAKAGIKPGAVVYDVGCGTGSMTEHFAKVVGSEGKVFAVDRSLEQLELTKKRIQEAGLTNVEFIQLDITADDLAFPQQADVIYARMVLGHLRSPENALNALLATLKAGGLLFLQEPVNSTNHAEGSDVVVPLVEVFMGNGKARGLDYDLGLKISQMASDQGLEIVDQFDWHAVMEPDIAREFLTISFNEWGKAALRDGLIDQDKFDKCMDIAITMDDRFHLAKNVYLTARKPSLENK